MKYSWKGHKDRNRHKNRIKKEWASSVYVKGINHNIPATWRWVRGDWLCSRDWRHFGTFQSKQTLQYKLYELSRARISQPSRTEGLILLYYEIIDHYWLKKKKKTSQAVETHRPYVDFTRHCVELGPRWKTRETNSRPVVLFQRRSVGPFPVAKGDLGSTSYRLQVKITFRVTFPCTVGLLSTFLNLAD